MTRQRTTTLAAGALAAALASVPALAREAGVYARVSPRAYARPQPGPLPAFLTNPDQPGPGAVFPVEGNENFPERPINRAEPLSQRGSGKQTGGPARALLPGAGPLWPFY